MTQPPQNSAPSLMRDYIKRIHEETERQRQIHEQRQAEESRLRELEARAKLAQYEPLEDQIRRWWANLPECQKNRRFQLVEIAANFRGKHKPKAALREVAAALRALGWREVRDWTNAGRNRRYWVQGKSSPR